MLGSGVCWLVGSFDVAEAFQAIPAVAADEVGLLFVPLGQMRQ